MTGSCEKLVSTQADQGWIRGWEIHIRVHIWSLTAAWPGLGQQQQQAPGEPLGGVPAHLNSQYKFSGELSGHMRLHIWSLKSKVFRKLEISLAILYLTAAWPGLCSGAVSPDPACCSQLGPWYWGTSNTNFWWEVNEEDMSSLSNQHHQKPVTSSHHRTSSKEDLHTMTSRDDQYLPSASPSGISVEHWAIRTPSPPSSSLRHMPLLITP